MKNLMLQNALIEQLNQNLNGEDFKDFILKLNEYFLNGVEPEFDGVKKLLFEMSRPYYEYLNQRYDDKVNGGGYGGFGYQEPVMPKKW